MSRYQRFLCGVPRDECSGGILRTDQTFTTNKCHSSREEAFKCMQRHLARNGFKQISTREFEDPTTGFIRLLPKRSHFGGRLRQGKGEAKSRFEPENKLSGGSGLIH